MLVPLEYLCMCEAVADCRLGQETAGLGKRRKIDQYGNAAPPSASSSSELRLSCQRPVITASDIWSSIAFAGSFRALACPELSIGVLKKKGRFKGAERWMLGTQRRISSQSSSGNSDEKGSSRQSPRDTNNGDDGVSGRDNIFIWRRITLHEHAWTGSARIGPVGEDSLSRTDSGRR